jgi:steroid Delta-isomerase
MIEMFADDAELVFEGIPVGPFHGREAIAAAYRTQPPDDEIDLLDTTHDNDGYLIASYAWRRRPGVRAGAIVLLPREQQIARLVIHYGNDGRSATS